jgi:hypothetical protein
VIPIAFGAIRGTASRVSAAPRIGARSRRAWEDRRRAVTPLPKLAVGGPCQ